MHSPRFYQPNEEPKIRAKVLVGAAIIKMLVAKNCKTFLQYASKVFIPYICSQAVIIQMIYVVWDCYFQDSLKSETRNN